MVRATDQAVIDECGLDAYLFLRFLKTMLRMYGAWAISVMPCLISLNVRAGSAPSEIHLGGLDRWNWGNVSGDNVTYYWAHFCCAWVVVISMCGLLLIEMRAFILLRHRQLSAAGPVQEQLILISDIPTEWRAQEKLKKLYGPLPGLRFIWINRCLDQPRRLVSRRADTVEALEMALTRLIQKCTRSAIKKSPAKRVSPRAAGRQWQKFLDQSDRETLRTALPRTSWFQISFKRVDKIAYHQRALADLSRQIHQSFNDWDRLPATSSAILVFADRFTAQAAVQFIRSPHAYLFKPTLLDTQDLGGILWQNLGHGWCWRYLRTTSVFAAMTGLILVWVVPVAVAGSMSQLSYLRYYFTWASRIDSLPSWALGVIQGVAPPALSASLMAVFPLLLRLLVRSQGLYTRAREELVVQKFYFPFLFIHLFLTVTVSSGLTAVAYRLVDNVRSAPVILAENLPKASNYFLSYLILQAFFGGALMFSRALRFAQKAVGWLLDRTPRQMWRRGREANVSHWGTLFPVYTNLACIGEFSVSIIGLLEVDPAQG